MLFMILGVRKKHAVSTIHFYTFVLKTGNIILLANNHLVHR